MKNVTVIAHPLVQHNLTRLRDARTQPQEFRRLLGEIAGLMTYEATRSLGVKKVSVRTPMEKSAGLQLEKEIVLVPVLRAGLGMLTGILEMIPHARVGFIGLKRDEATLAAHCYHQSLPKNLGGRKLSSLTRCSPPAEALWRRLIFSANRVPKISDLSASSLHLKASAKCGKATLPYPSSPPPLTGN